MRPPHGHGRRGTSSTAGPRGRRSVRSDPRTAQNRLGCTRGQDQPRPPSPPHKPRQRRAQTQNPKPSRKGGVMARRCWWDHSVILHAVIHAPPSYLTTSSSHPSNLIISSHDHQAAHASLPRHLAIPSPVHLIRPASTSSPISLIIHQPHHARIYHIYSKLALFKMIFNRSLTFPKLSAPHACRQPRYSPDIEKSVYFYCHPPPALTPPPIPPSLHPRFHPRIIRDSAAPPNRHPGTDGKDS